MFIALESVLIFNEKEPISENISERVAMILGKDYETRKNIKKEIKEYTKHEVKLHIKEMFTYPNTKLTIYQK